MLPLTATTCGFFPRITSVQLAYPVSKPIVGLESIWSIPMSLVGTLAKVAIGMAVAKGVSSMTKGASSQQASAGGGLGDLLGGMLGGGQSQQSSAGGLGGLMDALSGGQSAQSAQGGGLADMLGGLMGGQQASGAQGGGLADMLGGLMGGQQAQGAQGAQGGGLADMLGGLMGGGAAAGGLGGLMGALTGGQPASNDQSFGDVLNSSFANKGEPDVEPTADQNAVAALMLSAMIQAAKSDGAIQADEKQKLMQHLNDASPEEMAFVQSRLDAPVSIPDLVGHVPAGMQAQVYSMSLMAINLDSQAEAQYLNDLAHALGLNKNAVNQIHAHIGAPALYA